MDAIKIKENNLDQYLRNGVFYSLKPLGGNFIKVSLDKNELQLEAFDDKAEVILQNKVLYSIDYKVKINADSGSYIYYKENNSYSKVRNFKLNEDIKNESWSVICDFILYLKKEDLCKVKMFCSGVFLKKEDSTFFLVEKLSYIIDMIK